MTALYAGIVRVSQMGARKAGTDTFHADEEQVRSSDAYAHELSGSIEYMPPELDVSGGKPIAERPSLQAAIEGVEQGKYAGIIVAYLSRLTRSRSGLEIWDRVEAAGGKVLCARERLDTSTAVGRRIRDLHLSDAVYEREQKGEDWARRRKRSLENGIWMAGKPPRGYDKGPDRRLVPNTNAPDVLAAFHARANGTPLGQVARTLGVAANTMRGILRNRVYLGEAWDGENVNREAHPPLVDPELFAACQIEQPRPPRSTLDTGLLVGVIRCAGCGRNLKRGQSSSAQNGGKKYVTYACPSYRNCTPCPSPASISGSRVEAWVEEHHARPVFDALKARAEQVGDVSAERAAVAEARTELEAWVLNVSALSPSYAQGLAAREDAVATSERTLADRLAALPVRLGQDTYDDLTATERNAWLRGWLTVLLCRQPDGAGSRGIPVEDRVTVSVGEGIVVHGDREPVAGMLGA